MRVMRPAIFLDRDGVINENRADHVRRWDEFVPVQGALDGLRHLAGLGLPIFVVTNQAIVGRGELAEAELDALHARMSRLVADHGGRIDGVYACLHTAHDECACRKPRPGLFQRAAREHDLDLARSYYVGDALTDLAAGLSAGCTTLLVRTGRGLTQLLQPRAQEYRGYYVARDLAHAAHFITYQEALRAGRPRLLSDLWLAVRDVQAV